MYEQVTWFGRPHHDARRHLAGTDRPGPRNRARATSVRPPEPGAPFPVLG
jgi:hypothetical protein